MDNKIKTITLIAFICIASFFTVFTLQKINANPLPEIINTQKKISEYFVPVANLYSVEDNFLPEKQKVYTLSKYTQDEINQLKNLYPNIIITNEIDNILDTETKSVALVKIDDLSYKYKLLYFNSKYFLDDVGGAITTNVTSLNSVPTFDFSKIGKINQTGVTAITRGLAYKTDISGDFGYPAKNISDLLKNADIVHVSNEVSFVPNCNYIPNSNVFCAKPEYIKTLVDSGVNVVELTGNHNNDYGYKYNTQTLQKYAELGIKYFGGGLNTTDSQKILYENVKGTRVAFLGYNYYDTMQKTSEIAGPNTPGSNSYSPEKVKGDILEARKRADLIIVDFQFQECYAYPKTSAAYIPCYKPLADPDQVKTFRDAIDDGADIVVGTQAHQPQTYEIYNGKLIFYGLGNLFFDQTPWVGTRQGLILTHYIYNGKLIQTKITTTYYDNNMQTYITNGDQRKFLLSLLKNAR